MIVPSIASKTGSVVEKAFGRALSEGRFTSSTGIPKKKSAQIRVKNRKVPEKVYFTESVTSYAYLPMEGKPMVANTAILARSLESPAEKFKRLKAQWLREMPPSSRMRDLVLCKSYQRIIGMGKDALPFLLSEVEREPRAWFWALEAITEANPVPEGGDLNSIAQAWTRWASEHGF